MHPNGSVGWRKVKFCYGAALPRIALSCCANERWSIDKSSAELMSSGLELFSKSEVWICFVSRGGALERRGSERLSFAMVGYGTELICRDSLSSLLQLNSHTLFGNARRRRWMVKSSHGIVMPRIVRYGSELYQWSEALWTTDLFSSGAAGFCLVRLRKRDVQFSSVRWGTAEQRRRRVRSRYVASCSGGVAYLRVWNWQAIVMNWLDQPCTAAELCRNDSYRKRNETCLLVKNGFVLWWRSILW